MEKHTKNSLILKVYENSTLQLKDIKAAVNAFVNELIETIKAGETVEIRGLGVFSVKKRKKRKRYNFQMNCVMEEKQSLVVEFNPSRSLKPRKPVDNSNRCEECDVVGDKK